jgi:hypothetical protein
MKKETKERKEREKIKKINTARELEAIEFMKENNLTRVIHSKFPDVFFVFARDNNDGTVIIRDIEDIVVDWTVSRSSISIKK